MPSFCLTKHFFSFLFSLLFTDTATFIWHIIGGVSEANPPKSTRHRYSPNLPSATGDLKSGQLMIAENSAYFGKGIYRFFVRLKRVT